MNFVPNNNSKDKRNEEEIRALQESGAHIARARFDSIPNSDELRGRLKAQILAKRELKRTSMWEKIRTGLSHIIPTQKTFVFGMVVVLLVAMVSTMFINHPSGTQTGSTLAELLIDRAYAKDNFEITPTSGDGLAVDSTTAFIIKSKTAITKDALLSHLHLSPEAEFELTQISEHEFRVTPKNTLKEKQVYTIKIDAAYIDANNATVERDFSFAFQVKNQFKLLSSIPANKATGVPVNTGIELTFSSENYSDYEKNFFIEPKVAGKFEVHGRTLVFVPKELKPSTLYTITLSKNIAVKGTAPMTQDVVLRFETAPEYKSENEFFSAWYMNTDKAEFAPNGPMLMSFGNVSDQEFVVKAYAFKSFDAYKTNFLKQIQIPSWAYESRKNFVVPAMDLTLAREFTLKPQSFKKDYNQYLALPENLPKGDYWLEISTKGQTQHLFVEVTDIASYISITVDKTLLWVNDLSTKGPVSGAQISLASGGDLGTTNADGVATFETDRIQISTTTSRIQSVGVADQKVIQVTHGNESSLLLVGTNQYIAYNAKPAIDDYVLNFSSDRSLYLPNDTIKFWGYIAKKDKSAIPTTLTVGIPNSNNYFYGRDIGNQGYLQSLDVTPDAQGFFRGEIKLSNLTASGYSLVLQDGETQLSNRYIEVSQYVKPAFTLSVTGDKSAIYIGDTLNFKAQVNFFEGTPVPNYALTYSDENGVTLGTLKTDKNGEARGSITAQPNNSLPTGAFGRQITISSQDSEDTPLSQSVYYTVYPAKVAASHVSFDPITKNKALVSSTWNNLNIDVLNDTDWENDSKFFATPAAHQSVDGVVTETHYEKVENGDYYDFISKTTHKTYAYNQVTTTTLRFTAETDAQGHLVYEVPTVADRSYTVMLTLHAGSSGNAVETLYLYNNSFEPQSYNDTIWYSLRNTDEKTNPNKLSTGYKIGDPVQLQFYKNDQPLENAPGQFLFTQFQDGLKKYAVQKSSAYAFTFGEESIPNVFVGVVYFDGTRYVQTAEGDYRNSVFFDTSERSLKVEMTLDKSEYKPAENVTLNIKTTDKSGRGHAAKLNVSVIDEAFLALRGGGVYLGDGKGGGTNDILASLYRPVGDGVLFTEKSHRAADLGTFGGAEGGGCFLAGTQISLPNGTTKNIEDIAVGDVIVTFKSETDNTLVRGTVTKTQNHIVSEYLILNGTLQVTPEHRILVNGIWKTAGDVRVGDFLRSENGEYTKVTSVERRHALVKVYNFAVENYHTYIAGGVYVHNDKGGAATRSNFPDVALYQWVDTDKNGNGSVTFKLPDSVTSWRVTTEALSTDLYGGVNTKALPVSLPVFGIFSVPQDLLIGDQPTFSALAYGSSFKGNEAVQMSIFGDLLLNPVARTTKPFERNLVTADKPVAQSGTVTLQVNSSVGKDALKKSFTAVNSRVVESVQTLIPLKNGPLDLGAAQAAKSPIELKFVDAGKGSLYSRISDLSWNGGARLDQKVGTIVTHRWFKDLFAEDYLTNQADVNSYIGLGGFKLLPYGSEDLVLSAKVSAVLKDANVFDTDRMRTSFVGKLYDTNATSEELCVALWGAAALGEPVIPSIHTLAQNEKVLPAHKIYLALAVTELGDNEYARTIYEDLIKHVKETDTTAKIVFDKESKNEILQNSALMSVLAVRLQQPLADKFDKFVQDEPKEIVLNLEALLFVKEKLATLPKGSGSLNLGVGSQKVDIKIENGVSQSINVVPANFAAIQVANLKGPVALIAVYDAPADTSHVSTEVKLTREYFVGGQKVDALREGDAVEVRLTPVFGKDAPAGQYLVEDSIPSGLKIVSGMENFNPWYVASCSGALPFEVNGQLVKFMVDRTFQEQVKQAAVGGYYPYGCPTKPYLSYKARVATMGEFRREGALIESLESRDVKNFSTDVGMIQITE